MSNNILNVTEQTFTNEVIESKIPVLVEFGAHWCGPCQRQLPILESYENNNRGLVKVCKVDIDESNELARKYGIRSVPTIILFKYGMPTKTVVGLQTGQQLEAMIPEHQIDPVC